MIRLYTARVLFLADLVQAMRPTLSTAQCEVYAVEMYTRSLRRRYSVQGTVA